VTYFELSKPEKSLSGELQYLYRSPRFNVVTGAGYAAVDGHLDRTVNLFIPPPDGPGDFQIQDSMSTDVQHANVYAYGYLRPLESATFTLGLSADFLDGDALDVKDKDEVNPKLGVEWNLMPNTTLRAAAFKVLKRTLVTDQTLEPTQVAGFNQFFDDFNGASSWRYGVGLDQKFTREVFAGAEFSKRDIESPWTDFEDPENPVPRIEDITEYLGRAYAFWTPHPWLALSAQYLYEKVESEGLSTGQPLVLKTQRAPLGAKFFHPSGFGAGLTATYVDQDAQFIDATTGSSKFWVLDAALSYRLPNRYGFIAVGGTNLTDERFDFYDTDVRNPTLQPRRMVFARFTLALP